MNNYKTDNVTNNFNLLTFVLGAIGVVIFTWISTSTTAFAAQPNRLDYSRMSIDEVLMNADEFSTFSSILPGTDLELRLKEDRLTTVFVPSNKAFQELDTTTLLALLDDKELLNEIVNIHWTEGRAYTGYFHNERFFSPHPWIKLPVVSQSGNIYIGNAKIITSDISTQNGIIHVIDQIIMPQEEMKQDHIKPRQTKAVPNNKPQSTIEQIQEDSNDGRATTNVYNTIEKYRSFSTLTGLIQEAGLDEALSKSDVSITLFAPTNEAFEKIDKDMIVELKQNRIALLQVLLTHVVPEKIFEDDMRVFVQSEETLGSSSLRFSRLNSPLVENARIIAPNLEATNGIIHAVDRVIQIQR